MSEGFRQRRVHNDNEDVPLIRPSGAGLGHQLSFWDSLKSRLLVTLVGLVLLVGGVVLQFWNEGRAVHVCRALDEGAAATVFLKSTAGVSDEHEGRLVHMTAAVHVPQPLQERRHGVSIHAVKLKRRVQVYQWLEEETTRTVDGSEQQEVERSFHYITGWRDKLVDSSTFNNPFGHENPKSMPLQSTVEESAVAQIGSFSVSSELRRLFDTYTVFASDERPTDPSIKLHTDIFYHCTNILAPRVGDIRVQFSYAGKSGDLYSVVGMQSGDQLVPYTASNGHQLLLLKLGRHTHHQLFSEQQAQNRLLTWTLRGAGWLLCFLAFSCLTNILHALAVRVPVLGQVLAVGIASWNLFVSMAVSLCVISISWMWYRPLLAGCTLALAAAVLYWRFSWRPQQPEYPGAARYTVTRPGRPSRTADPPAHRPQPSAPPPPPYGFNVPM